MSPKKASITKKSTKSGDLEKVVEEVSAREKKINPQNYFYAFLILVGGILLTLLIFKWYNTKKEEKLMISYLVSTNTIESSISDLNSLDLIKQESPSSYFIYLGFTKDEEVYNLERELKELIDDYKLNDIFYYVDLTEYREKDKEYLDIIKEKLDIEDLKQVPAIIFIENGQVEEILDGVKNTSLKIDDVKKLLDVYGFEAVK